MKFGVLQGCLLVAAVVLVAIGVGAGVTLAKTGLVPMPILSSVLESASRPTRVVSASNSASESAVTALAQKLHLETARISESEATTLLRSYLAASRAHLPIADPQLVFLDGVIEFFGVVENEGRSATVRLRASASFSEEALRLRIEEITIGALNIPSGIPNFIAAAALKDQIAALEQQLARSSVRELLVRDGFVEIAF